MCGTADERPPPAPIPVELPTRRPTTQSNVPVSRTPTAKPKPKPRDLARPASTHGHDRPPTKHRREHAHTSAGNVRVPQTAYRQSRGGETSATGGRNLKTAAGTERHNASRGGERTHQRERTKAKLTGNEEFIEDTTIVELVKEVTTFVDQHTRTFYPISDQVRRGGGGGDLDEPRTRHAAIRRQIAQAMIDSVVMDSETNTQEDLRFIASNICNALRAYTNNDVQVVAAHLFEICKLADELREAIDSHPLPWSFGSWERFGYIVMFPALLKNGQEVLKSQRFKSLE